MTCLRAARIFRAAVVAAAVFGAGSVLAAPDGRWGNRRDEGGGRWSHPTPRRKSVPEFDPAAAGAVAAVLAGGGLLLARRGRKGR